MKLLLRNRKGQGTTEYIVILAIVIIALMSFWNPIKKVLTARTGEIVSDIGQAGRQ